MIDFLSSASWQGIGAISSILIAILSFVFSQSTRYRVFRTKNSEFNNSMLPRELISGQSTILFGKVRDEVFPGPPNYESINNGDKPQFYWIIYTNESIKLIGRSEDTDELYEVGSSCMFQLCVPKEFYDKRLDILGKYVKVTGDIFLGHTGHHKTKALINVSSIKILK